MAARTPTSNLLNLPRELRQEILYLYLVDY
jgi:hypothetical protein